MRVCSVWLRDTSQIAHRPSPIGMQREEKTGETTTQGAQKAKAKAKKLGQKNPKSARIRPGAHALKLVARNAAPSTAGVRRAELAGALPAMASSYYTTPGDFPGIWRQTDLGTEAGKRDG